MENQPEEKTIIWDPTYVSLLGLDKTGFHRIFEDNYEGKFEEITNILKLINDNVIEENHKFLTF